MISIFKQRKELKEELEMMTAKYNAANRVGELYCEELFAYKNAIWELHMQGLIDEETYNRLFSAVEKYRKVRQSV